MLKKGVDDLFFRDYHRTITCYYEKLTGAVCDKYNLTQMEYDILMFLHDNPQYNTAAEIVKIRRSTKSHVSTSLRMLEEKGLIEKRQSEDNKKHIAIILLDKAKTIVNEGTAVQKQFARDILDGLSEEEMDMCKAVFEKIYENAEKRLKQFK